MKIKVRLKEDTVKRNLQKIKYMILYDRIKLSSIPRSQRTANKSLYIMAFRASESKADCDGFIQSLRILANDIVLCNEDNQRKQLLPILNAYIENSRCSEDKRFEIEKKTILQQLQIYQ